MTICAIMRFGGKKLNKILVKNAKINAKFVMHLLQSSKHLWEIHQVGQISGMHHCLVFFSTFSLRPYIVLPAPQINHGP